MGAASKVLHGLPLAFGLAAGLHPNVALLAAIGTDLSEKPLSLTVPMMDVNGGMPNDGSPIGLLP
jgi:hypothetical protein